MPKARLELHTLLETVSGIKNIWFQPGASMTLSYPCILYEVNEDSVRYSSNKLYFHKKRYKVTVITRDPDSIIPDKILHGIPYCEFINSYVSDQLYHSVFNVYYKTDYKEV